MKSFFQRIHESHSGPRKPTSNDTKATYHIWVPPTKPGDDQSRQLPSQEHVHPPSSMRRTGEKRSSSRTTRPPDDYETYTRPSNHDYTTVLSTAPGRTSRARTINPVASAVPLRSQPHSYTAALQSSSQRPADQSGRFASRPATDAPYTPAPEQWIPPLQQVYISQPEDNFRRHRKHEKHAKPRGQSGEKDQGGTDTEKDVPRKKAREAEKGTRETEELRYGEAIRERERERERERRREKERVREKEWEWGVENAREREKEHERQRERKTGKDQDRMWDRDKTGERRREARGDRDRLKGRERESEREVVRTKDSFERNQTRPRDKDGPGYGEGTTRGQRDRERGGRHDERENERFEESDKPHEVQRLDQAQNREAVAERRQDRDKAGRRDQERETDKRRDQDGQRDMVAESGKYRNHRANAERDRNRPQDKHDYLDRRYEPGREGLPWASAATLQPRPRQHQDLGPNREEDNTSSGSLQMHPSTLPTRRHQRTDQEVLPTTTNVWPGRSVPSAPPNPTLLHRHQPTLASSSSETQAGIMNKTPSALPVHNPAKEAILKVSQDRQYSQVDLPASGLSGSDGEGTKRGEHRHRSRNTTLDAIVERPTHAPPTEAASVHPHKETHDRTVNYSDAKPGEPSSGLSSRWPFSKSKVSSHNPPTSRLDVNASRTPAKSAEQTNHIERPTTSAEVEYSSAAQAASHQAQMSRPSLGNAEPVAQASRAVKKHSRNHSRDSLPASERLLQNALLGSHPTPSVKHRDSRSHYQLHPSESALKATASVEVSMVDVKEPQSYGRTEVPVTHRYHVSIPLSEQASSQPQQSSIQGKTQSNEFRSLSAQPDTPPRNLNEYQSHSTSRDRASDSLYSGRLESSRLPTQSTQHRQPIAENDPPAVSYSKTPAHVASITAEPETSSVYETLNRFSTEATSSRSHPSHGPALVNQRSQQAYPRIFEDAIQLYDDPSQSYGTTKSGLETSAPTQPRTTVTSNQTSYAAAQLNQSVSHSGGMKSNSLEAAVHRQPHWVHAPGSSNQSSQQGHQRSVGPPVVYIDEKSVHYYGASMGALEAAATVQPRASSQVIPHLAARFNLDTSQHLNANKSSAPESTKETQPQVAHAPKLSSQVSQQEHSTKTEAAATQPSTSEMSIPATGLDQSAFQSSVSVGGSVPVSTTHPQSQPPHASGLPNQTSRGQSEPTGPSTRHLDEKPSKHSATSKVGEIVSTSQSRPSVTPGHVSYAGRFDQNESRIYGATKDPILPATTQAQTYPLRTSGPSDRSTSKGALSEVPVATQPHTPDQSHSPIRLNESVPYLQGELKGVILERTIDEPQPSNARASSNQAPQRLYPMQLNDGPSHFHDTSKNETPHSRAPSTHQDSFQHRVPETPTATSLFESRIYIPGTSRDTTLVATATAQSHTSLPTALPNQVPQPAHPREAILPATQRNQNVSHPHGIARELTLEATRNAESQFSAENAAVARFGSTGLGDARLPQHRTTGQTSNVPPPLPFSNHSASQLPSNTTSTPLGCSSHAANDFGTLAPEPSLAANAALQSQDAVHPQTHAIMDGKRRHDQRNLSPVKMSGPNLVADYEARPVAPNFPSRKDPGANIARPSTAMGYRQISGERGIPSSAPSAVGLPTGSTAQYLKFPLQGLDSNARLGASLQRPATAMSSRHHRVHNSHSLEPPPLWSHQTKVHDLLQPHPSAPGAASHARGGSTSNYGRQADQQLMSAPPTPAASILQQTHINNNFKRRVHAAAPDGTEQSPAEGPESSRLAAPITSPDVHASSRDIRAGSAQPVILSYRSVDSTGGVDPRAGANSLEMHVAELPSVFQQTESLATSRGFGNNEAALADAKGQDRSKARYPSHSNPSVPQRSGYAEQPVAPTPRSVTKRAADVPSRGPQRQSADDDRPTTQIYRPPVHHAKLAELLSSPVATHDQGMSRPVAMASDATPTFQDVQSSFTKANVQPSSQPPNSATPKARHSPPKIPYEVDAGSNVLDRVARSTVQTKPQYSHSHTHPPDANEMSQFTTLPTPAVTHDNDPSTPLQATQTSSAGAYPERSNAQNTEPQGAFPPQPSSHKMSESQTTRTTLLQGVSASRNNQPHEASQKYHSVPTLLSSTYPAQTNTTRSQSIAAETIKKSQQIDRSRIRGAGTMSNTNPTVSQIDLTITHPVMPPPHVTSSQAPSTRPPRNVSISSNSVSPSVDPVFVPRTHPSTSTRINASELRSDTIPQQSGPGPTRLPTSEPSAIHPNAEKLPRKPSDDSILLKTPSSLAQSMLKPTVSRTSIPASLSSQPESRKRGLFGMFRSRTNQPPAPTEEVQKPITERIRRKESKSKAEVPAEMVPSSQDTKVVSSLASRVKPPLPITVPIPIQSVTGRRSPNSKVFTPFRYLTSKRHRTMSAASLEAQDGTAPNTVVGSPTASMHSTQPPPIQPPPLRDPLIATQEWRKQEAAEAREVSGGRLRRARPGVVFDVAEDPHEDEKRRPTRSRTPSRPS